MGTTQTASGSADLRFTSIGTASYYNLKCTALVPVTTGDILLQFSEDNGATWKTSGYSWQKISISNNGAGVTSANSSAAVGIRLGGSFGGAPGADIDAEINNISSVTAPKFARARAAFWDGTNYYSDSGSGIYSTDNGAVNAVRVIRADSSNLASGKCSLYSYSS